MPKRLNGPMSQRLRQARTNAGLSQQALADEIGIALRTILYYEDPSYTRTRKQVIVRAWATITGVPFEQLWGSSRLPIDRTGWLNRNAA